MNKQILISTLIMSFLIIATIGVVIYGKGYRFDMDKGKPDLSGTGLLVATSKPNGASVFVNDKLATATDNTINLAPGLYKIKVSKEGYTSWQKEIKIQKEVVSKADALLFSTAPKLENITAGGVETPIIDPSMSKIAYTVTSQETKKNGVYVLDMSEKPILTLQSASVQIVDDTFDSFSTASLSWSPDGKELIASVSGNQRSYLLSASGFNDNPKNITLGLEETEAVWTKDKNEKDESRLKSLRLPLQKIINDNFNIISWSPDETKIMYQAKNSVTIPIIIKPRLIGTNSTPEDRSIKADFIYIYDTKEDRNYLLPYGNILETANKQESELANTKMNSVLNWLPDSNHLLYVHDKRIEIMDYDGINRTTVYAGPFMANYVFPWSTITKILILTDLNNPDILPNLYTIGLK